jgi:hypothetical protein
MESGRALIGVSSGERIANRDSGDCPRGLWAMD